MIRRYTLVHAAQGIIFPDLRDGSPDMDIGDPAAVGKPAVGTISLGESRLGEGKAGTMDEHPTAAVREAENHDIFPVAGRGDIGQLFPVRRKMRLRSRCFRTAGDALFADEVHRFRFDLCQHHP